MPFTNWKSWTSDDVLTSSDMNTYQRDNGRWLSHNLTGGAPTCRVWNSAAQTITTATDTTLTFDSEDYDVAGMHSTVTNTGRLTAPSGSAGLYLVGCSIQWASVASPAGLRQLVLRNDGTTVFAAISHDAVSVSNTATFQTITGLVNLTTGGTSYVEARVRHTQGSNLNVDAGAAGSYQAAFWAIWLGENQ